MRVDIVVDKTLVAKQIVISCNEYNKGIGKIRKYAEQIEDTILIKDGNDKILIIHNDIFYIESVDKRTFIYLENRVVECEMRLYELEKLLDKFSFLRISKSFIVNIAHVKSIVLMINRNLTLTMKNKEKVIVSRRYVKKFNEIIGME